MNARTHRLEDLRVGDAVWFDVTLDAERVDRFAALTGDFSPIHVSVDAARYAGFAERVVHGMLMASFASTIVGMFLPGERATFAAEKMDFVEIVPVGSTVTVSGRVSQISVAAGAIVLSFVVLHRGIAAVRGQATARVREG